jgi:hypothetical protein
MEPTLHPGDRLLVRYAAQPAPGRLALVRLPPDGDGAPRPVAVKRLSRRVAEGWWVERDNPAEGVDSWLVGAVAEADVLALVLLRLWPGPSLLRRRPGNGSRDAGGNGPG